MCHAPGVPSCPSLQAIRNARSMPAASIWLIICSSVTPCTSSGARPIFLIWNSRIQAGRAATIRGVSGLTTASMAPAVTLPPGSELFEQSPETGDLVHDLVRPERVPIGRGVDGDD